MRETKCEWLKVKQNYFLLFFIIEDSLFVESTNPLHYGRFRCIEIFLSEDEAKLLGNSVCQNLNVSACFVCVLASNVSVIYVSLLLLLLLLLSTLVIIISIISKFEGGRFRYFES